MFLEASRFIAAPRPKTGLRGMPVGVCAPEVLNLKSNTCYLIVFNWKSSQPWCRYGGAACTINGFLQGTRWFPWGSAELMLPRNSAAPFTGTREHFV
jgi:hypothetical protein